jgi:multimeric flavodoxin WrbA
LKYQTSLVNKVGGAFSTVAGEYGGKEHVLYSFVIAMMNAGMIIVGTIIMKHIFISKQQKRLLPIKRIIKLYSVIRNFRLWSDSKPSEISSGGFYLLLS